MGSRNFRKRETKKPKKVEKKLAQSSVYTPQPVVEIVRKSKKTREEEESGEEK